MTNFLFRAYAILASAILVISDAESATIRLTNAVPSKTEVPSSSIRKMESFGVRQSIEMKQPWYLNSTDAPEPQFATTSPDGKSSLLLTMRGDLSSGKNHYTLWLYDTEELRKFAASGGQFPRPQGRPIFQLSTNDFSHTYSGGPFLPIRELRWQDHGALISFILAEEGDAGDIYLLDISSGHLRRLTKSEGQVVDYAISKENSVVVYLANVIQDCHVAFLEPEKVGQYAFPIHTGACENPGLAQRFPRQRMQVFKAPLHSEAEDTQTPVGVPISGLLTYAPDQSTLRLSPDGRWATLLASPDSSLPAHWSKYFPMISGIDLWTEVGGSRKSSNLVGEGLPMAPQFLLVDVENGTTAPIFDAPAGFSARLSDSHWLPDSRTVILTHTHLPDNVFPDRNSAPPPEKIHFVEYDVYEKKLTPFHTFDDPIALRSILNESVMTTELVGAGQLVARIRNNPIQRGQNVMENGIYSYRVFEKLADGWKSRESRSVPNTIGRRAPLVVSVREDLNTPPDYYVEDAESGRGARLTDLNPELRNINIPEARIFKWTAGDGKQWKAALILPPTFNRSRRYPLVIQIHCLRENKFFRDASDPAETAPYAGRALASAGFVVLHVPAIPETWDSSTRFDSPQGYHVIFEGLRSAIDKLAEENLVDPERIGIVGWSGGGRTAMEVLTKSGLNIGAVVVADAATFGPLSYFLSAGWPVEKASIVEESVGGYPWGDGKQQWIENNSIYLLDKVRAALRIETYYRAVRSLGMMC